MYDVVNNISGYEIFFFDDNEIYIVLQYWENIVVILFEKGCILLFRFVGYYFFFIVKIYYI